MSCVHIELSKHEQLLSMRSVPAAAEWVACSAPLWMVALEKLRFGVRQSGVWVSGPFIWGKLCNFSGLPFSDT